MQTSDEASSKPPKESLHSGDNDGLDRDRETELAFALSGTLSSINADLPSLTYTMSAPYSTNPSYLGDYIFMDVKDSEDGAVGEGAFSGNSEVLPQCFILCPGNGWRKSNGGFCAGHDRLHNPHRRLVARQLRYAVIEGL